MFPYLAAIRASAQMISYEVSIGLIILSVVVCTGSLNLTEIVMAQRYI
jgi:NADH-quinone oxidoreductase subunit H